MGLFGKGVDDGGLQNLTSQPESVGLRRTTSLSSPQANPSGPPSTAINGWEVVAGGDGIGYGDGSLEMVPTTDSFEYLSDEENAPSIYNTGGGWEGEINHSYDGSMSIENSDNHGPDTDLAVKNIDYAPEKVSLDYRVTSNDGGHNFYRVYNTSGQEIFGFYGSNPEVGFYAGSGTTELKCGPSPNYKEWRRFTGYIDWEAEEVTVVWEDLTGNTATQSATDSFANSASKIGKVASGEKRDLSICGSSTSGGSTGNIWYDNFWGALAPSASVTVGTETFSTPAEPDLENLSYSLNGQSIDLTVIGSPNRASEETVTQSLGGASSYTLSWSNSHTAFRVKIDVSSSDRSTTPTISSVDLAPAIVELGVSATATTSATSTPTASETPAVSGSTTTAASSTSSASESPAVSGSTGLSVTETTT